MERRIQVAGVPIDPLTLKEAAERAAGFLSDGRQHLIATPNPEMAVLADRDPSFRRILDSADMALCDGYGLKLAASLAGERVPEVITGVDFTLTLALLAEQHSCSVYFLGGVRGVAAEAAGRIKKEVPSLRVAGVEDGGRIRWIAGNWKQDVDLVRRIAKAEPDILFVALGHGKQERWIHDHLRRMPSVKIAVGIGGALDYWSGRARRAPRLLRRLHLEWLWRLLLEPWRLPRIFDATVRFVILALKKRERKG
jgi:N-acetylglucosaminyldiphosphoundecaprenol N-acetyl-beta-D-mannosaminyltransferase